jgi:hypothetical protein
MLSNPFVCFLLFVFALSVEVVLARSHEEAALIGSKLDGDAFNRRQPHGDDLVLALTGIDALRALAYSNRLQCAHFAPNHFLHTPPFPKFSSKVFRLPILGAQACGPGAVPFPTQSLDIPNRGCSTFAVALHYPVTPFDPSFLSPVRSKEHSALSTQQSGEIACDWISTG